MVSLESGDVVPAGRSVAAGWLKQFTAALRAGGFVQRAADRAGLRGLVDE